MPIFLIRINIFGELNLISYIYKCFITRCFFNLVAKSSKYFKYFLWLFSVECERHFLLFFISHFNSESTVRRQASILIENFYFCYRWRHQCLILDANSIIIIFMFGLILLPVIIIIEYLLRVIFFFFLLFNDYSGNMHKYHITANFKSFKATHPTFYPGLFSDIIECDYWGPLENSDWFLGTYTVLFHFNLSVISIHIKMNN